jgi:hypothetical protein
MQRLWSLYNKDEKLRIDDLTAENVKIILLSIPTAKMSEWFACQEGDLHWQPIATISEFYEDVRQIKGVSFAPKMAAGAEYMSPTRPPVEERRPLFEDAPEETAKTLQIENEETNERRSARRFPRQLTFLVSKAGKTFEGETVDISMSGLSLKSPLPDWVTKTFRAHIELNGQTTGVLCLRVDDRKVKFLEADSWNLIRLWIVNW